MHTVRDSNLRACTLIPSNHCEYKDFRLKKRMHERIQNAAVQPHSQKHTHLPPQALAQGQWSLSWEHKDLIDWLLTQ